MTIDFDPLAEALAEATAVAAREEGCEGTGWLIAYVDVPCCNDRWGCACNGFVQQEVEVECPGCRTPGCPADEDPLT